MICDDLPRYFTKKNLYIPQFRVDFSIGKTHNQKNSTMANSPGPGPLGQHQVGQGVVVLLLVPPERRWDQMLSHELLASWVNYGLW